MQLESMAGESSWSSSRYAGVILEVVNSFLCVSTWFVGCAKHPFSSPNAGVAGGAWERAHAPVQAAAAAGAARDVRLGPEPAAGELDGANFMEQEQVC
jgi:hypothetical protein